MQLWRADFKVPFTYSGDSLLDGIATKGAIEHGWWFHNDSVGASAAALAVYIRWWITSQHEVKHFAYLHYGTPIDVGITLSIAVCLVLLLGRLFDGEKSIVWSNRPFQ